MTEPAILLFDGVCNLCNHSVQWVIKYDKARNFRFTSQQSDYGQALLKQHQLSDALLQTLILIENGKAYTQSTAVLRVTRKMDGLWPVLYPLIFVPRPIRDMVYNYIAKKRYDWFGKMDACMVPAPDQQELFLD